MAQSLVQTVLVINKKKEIVGKEEKDKPDTAKPVALAEITHKINESNNIPYKKIKKHQDTKNNKPNVQILPYKDVKTHNIALKEIPTNQSSKTTDTNTSENAKDLKRANNERGKECFITSTKNAKPVEMIRLLNEDGGHSSWPVFKEADCGFNWKLSLKIFNSTSDDDHKTPPDMISYTSKEVLNDLKSTLSLYTKLGKDAFNNKLVNYRRYNKK
jgi:hypothetical protein